MVLIDIIPVLLRHSTIIWCSGTTRDDEEAVFGQSLRKGICGGPSGDTLTLSSLKWARQFHTHYKGGTYCWYLSSFGDTSVVAMLS